MGEVNVGGGQLEMNTDVVAPSAGRLSQAGADFSGGLAGILARIKANESGIGTNAGAAEFRVKYQGAAPGLTTSAAGVTKAFNGFGTSVTKAIADYERVDREHRDAIARSTGG